MSIKKYFQQAAKVFSGGILKMAGLQQGVNFADWEKGGLSSVRRSAESWLLEFGRHALLYPPVNRLGRDTAGNRWGLYREQDGKRVQVLDHPALNLFNEPCPGVFLGHQVRYLIQTWLDLVGEAFLLVERGKNGEPVRLYPVPPSWILLRPYAKNRNYQILLQDNTSQVVTINEKDVIVFCDPDPARPYGRGLGAAFALDDEITGDTYAAKWNLQFFRNSARPDVLVGVEDAQLDDLKKLKTQWDAKHKGIWGAHEVSFLPGNIKAAVLSKGQKEMDFVKLRTGNRDRINQAYGVPPEVLGIVENSNRATAEAAMALYQTNCLKPRLEAQKAVFNSRLLPQFGNTDGMFFDFENPVAESRTYTLDQAERSLKAGAITRNEYRKMLGMNPATGQDVFIIPLNCEVVPVGQEPQGRKPAGGNGKSVEKSRIFS